MGPYQPGAVAQDDSEFDGLLQAALQIAENRRKKLEEMREAFERNDLDTAIKLARQLAGLPTIQNAAASAQMQ